MFSVELTHPTFIPRTSTSQSVPSNQALACQRTESYAFYFATIKIPRMAVAVQARGSLWGLNAERGRRDVQIWPWPTCPTRP